MRTFVSALFLVVGIGLAAAQGPPPTTPKEKAPAKLPPSPLDKVDGYKRFVIAGFTVMVSTEAQAGEVKGAELAPMDVLELELSTIKKVVPAKHVQTLQKIPVWVDWDDKPAMSNGRPGSSLAVYYGGSQLDLLQRGKNPYKAKCITVNSLKSLTKMHQPGAEDQTIILLHEYAHAVHDQYLGFEHAGIKVAYKQAMERKLYDKEQYVSTNDAEFFAETTCAYYDQLDHFPKTRDDLKKHDPATHKLLESIWGTVKRPAFAGFSAPKAKKLIDSSGADKFDLAIAAGSIKFGEQIHGPDFKLADAKDHVLVVSNFSNDEILVLDKLAKMHDELSSYGAKVVVAHSYMTNPEDLKRKLAERNVSFATFDKAFFPQKGEDRLRSGSPGHTLVFDADGKCVFRGSGHEALAHARGAVARGLIAKSFPMEIPKPFVALAESLSQGAFSLWEAVPKLAGIAQAGTAETATLAKDFSAVIAAPVQAMYIEAAGKAKADPISAFVIAEKIAKDFKGAPVTAKANTLMDQLRLNPVVTKELAARVLLEPIRKLDTHLSSQPGGFDPTSPRFQYENSTAIQQIVELQAQLKKKHPAARATDEGAKLVAKYRSAG